MCDYTVCKQDIFNLQKIYKKQKPLLQENEHNKNILGSNK